jgi:hypothetical protein
MKLFTDCGPSAKTLSPGSDSACRGYFAILSERLTDLLSEQTTALVLEFIIPETWGTRGGDDTPNVPYSVLTTERLSLEPLESHLVWPVHNQDSAGRQLNGVECFGGAYQWTVME